MRGAAKILPRKGMWKGLRHGLEKSLNNHKTLTSDGSGGCPEKQATDWVSHSRKDSENEFSGVKCITETRGNWMLPKSPCGKRLGRPT